MNSELIMKFAHLFDPETIHDVFFDWYRSHPQLMELGVGAFFNQYPLETVGKNIKWRNPLALAAGFDKNAEALNLWDKLGFGAVEIGTVTPLPQVGNPRPRIKRYGLGSIQNSMGFPSLGMEYVKKNLQNFRGQCQLGVNIGKNKLTPNELAYRDYATLYEELAGFSDYMVINVSSPNTPGLRDLQSASSMRTILEGLNKLRQKNPKPVFIKVSPDICYSDLDDLWELAKEYSLAGFVSTNTTSQLTAKGGVSGQLLKEISRNITLRLLQKNQNEELFDIICVGGITSTDDIFNLKDSGAQFFQIYSSFVYQGPGIIQKLLATLIN
jgi:dihydroorotate dehydrogenase